MPEQPVMRAAGVGGICTADEVISGFTPSPVSALSVVDALRTPERNLRWTRANSFRSNWRGVVVSLGLHVGTVAFATGILVEAPDGSAASAPQAVEIELISADAFNALASTSGSSSDESEDTNVEASLPEVSPPATVDLSDAMAASRPDASVIAEVPTEIAQLGTALAPPDPISAVAEEDEMKTSSMSSAAHPGLHLDAGQLETRGRPPETPPLPVPRPTKRDPQKTTPSKVAQRPRLRTAPGKAGHGADAASQVAALRGATGRASTAGAGIMDSFRARVMAHLLRHKRYPEAARERGIRGRVLVTFSFSANGQVTSVALRNASGSALLDSEAVAMVRRASPFPSIPPEMGSVQADFTAPIVYNMN